MCKGYRKGIREIPKLNPDERAINYNQPLIYKYIDEDGVIKTLPLLMKNNENFEQHLQNLENFLNEMHIDSITEVMGIVMPDEIVMG